MDRIADISPFLSLQNNFYTTFNAEYSNASVEELDKLVSDVLDQIEVLRELNADEVAEAEESKIESTLSKTRERFNLMLESIRSQAAKIKQTGAWRDDAADDVSASTSAGEEMGEDEFDLSGLDLGGEEEGGEEEGGESEGDEHEKEGK